MADPTASVRAAASGVSFSRELIASFINEDRQDAVETGSIALPAATAGASTGDKSSAQSGEINKKQPVILQYATYLGMDPMEDTELLWIAQQALTAPLPPNWTEHTDPMSGDSYYHNEQTMETVWEHPCDEYFRNLYQSLKETKIQRAAKFATVPAMVSPIPSKTADDGMLSVPFIANNKYFEPMRKEVERSERKAKKMAARAARRAERKVRNENRLAANRQRAARRIQRNWRCFKFRMRWAAFISEKKAAITLQSRVRGMLGRKAMGRALLEQVEQMAIVNLQAAFRGHKCRQMLERRRKIAAAAVKASISKQEGSSAAKVGHAAFLARVGMAPAVTNKSGENLAGEDQYNRVFVATRLQAVFRGTRARRYAKAQVSKLEREYADAMQL
eukprot:SAG31_NODE_2199_length_6208_cov_3.935996_3_plen_390_part_00